MDASRLLLLKPPPGTGALTLVRLRVTEELGLPYTIEGEAYGEKATLVAKDFIGKPVTCSVVQAVEGAEIKRHFHGFVAEFERVGPAPRGLTAYRFTARPEAWRLSLSSDTRIFQQMSVKEIVDLVFKDRGLPAPVAGTGWANGTKRTYCTQFNETDLAFVSRLLEEQGFILFFVQDDGSHELRICKGLTSLPAFAHGDVTALHNAAAIQQLAGWRRANRTRVGKVQFSDMDLERSDPAVTLDEDAPTVKLKDEPDLSGNGVLRRWPSGKSVMHDDQAKPAMQALEGASESFHAETQDPRFAAGVRPNIKVVKEDGSTEDANYAVLAVRHEATDLTGIEAGAGGISRYRGALTLAVANRSWGPPQRHRRPVMPGFCTASVTGPSKEEIHVDEFGRIKVLFRWDHLGKADENSSCWVRVMQPAAGAWGGTWFLPRVGDEVVVAFLEGDPDRPIVVGSVYGKQAKPPFALPANKTQSGYVTRSSKEGGKEDANILRFEDKKGSEEVYLHAQKTLTIKIEGNRTTTIDGKDFGGKVSDVFLIKDGHRTVTIDKGNDTYLLKQGKLTETIETGDHVYLLKTGKLSETIKTGDHIYELATGKLSETIKMGDHAYELGMGNRTSVIKMGNDDLTLKMGNESHKLGLGNFALKCDLGKVTIEAMQSITLKVGASSVKIDQTGVSIEGMMVKISGTAMLQTKAPIAMHKADAIMMIKGGLVMIN